MNNKDEKIKSYLNGAITVESRIVPAEERTWTPDDRGEVTVVLKDKNVNFIEYAEFSREGVKRGHHYHTDYVEYLYVLSGRIKVIAHVFSTGEEITFEVEKCDMLTIQPNVAHGFISLSRAEVLTSGYGANPFEDRKVFSAFSKELYE